MLQEDTNLNQMNLCYRTSLMYLYILGMFVLLVYNRVSSVAMDTLSLLFVYIVYIDGLNPLFNH